MKKIRSAGPFAVVTLLLGAIAIVLIAWRISKAWRIEYGGAPREPPPIPTTGSFGPPPGPETPAPSGSATPPPPAQR